MSRLTTIQTYTGKIIDPYNLKEEDIDIRDIAHALSQMPRFAGHLQDFYSVAQHSIRCCLLAMKTEKNPEKIFLEILLHDAAEAYIMDMPAPIKWRIKGYKDLESHVQSVISSKFKLDLSNPRIKVIDQLALEEELNALMYGNLPCDAWYINCRSISMKATELDFLNVYSKWKRTK